MEDPNLTKHYFISGRVQGVGFRAFTQKVALRLKLAGWVRNVKDGRVEAMATGYLNQIEAFEQELRRGPASGHVTQVEVTEASASKLPEVFEIRKDAE